MTLRMPYTSAHPDPGEEVMAMDDVDVDVHVRDRSLKNTSNRWERMSRDE
jgi:hypothetical protein